MTFPLNEMYGYSRLCDRLRSPAIIWKQVSLRSSAIRDRLRSFAIIWKPAFSSEEYNVVKFRAEFYSGCQVKNKSKNLIDNSTTDLMHA